jgi:iron complex outermembrane receptor protein
MKGIAMITTVTLNPAIDRTVIVDTFTYGAVNRVGSSREDMGGKGINVVRILRALGSDALATGFVGSRNMGVFQPVVRGVGSTGISIGDEPNIATYIDGVYQPESAANWIDLVEVERVEVLRGPQGTTFGRNATGGLINVITPDPSFDFRGKASLRVGRMRREAGDYDARLYVTGPISEKAAIDLSGLFRKNDGYIDDLVRGGTLGDQRVIDLRSKFLFKPADNFKVVLTGEFFDQKSTSPAYS